MTHDLQDLADNRDALLLGEVAAFLHDWDKCIKQWISLGNNFNPSQTTPRVKSSLEGCSLQDPLNLSTADTSLAKIIKEGKNPSKAKLSLDWRIKLLGKCHDVAHVDKPEEEQGLREESKFIGSIFGFEITLGENSSKLLEAVQSIDQRDIFIHNIEQAFNNAVGDTRRPLNEVRLSEWGAATAAFWKAIAARYILENKVTENNLKWRILSVRFDGLSFLERSLTIGDLHGRKKSLQLALNCVRRLLEETYALGNEVYRDENGSAFLVPELENDIDGNQLLNLIENQILNNGWKREFEINGELKPQVYLTKSHEKAIVLHEALQQELPNITPFQDCSDIWWQSEISNICTVCGVRSQGWGGNDKKKKEQAKSRNVCSICLERRSNRAKIWLQDLTKEDIETRDTIWIDEVADNNARLALVVGQFDLNDWLSGDMIKTLLVVCSPSVKEPEKKPSFARIQRVWRTTQQFWQTALADTKLPKIKGRLSIEFNNIDQIKLQSLGSYDLVLGTTKLSVLHNGCKLITTDNLCYAAKKLGAKSEQYSKIESAAEFIAEQLRYQQFFIEEPTGYGSSNKLPGKLNINNVLFEEQEYSPIIPILSEPSTFMALVPAEKSLDVVEVIKTKYEREMGKVRNRLPLHLGVVYFDRRTPLRSALDAGRQMLSYKSSSQQLWQVQSKTQGTLPPEKQKLANGTKQFEETITISLINLVESDTELIQGDRKITWHVPNKMGDGTTDDNWYPYVFVKTKDDQEVDGRSRKIKSQRPGITEPCWLVHAGDLKEGDQIYFTPSTFDFEYLDSTARRFDIHYDEKDRRPRKTRPFYLEDLDRIQTLWKILKNLETSQRHQVIYSIEATRDIWYGEDIKQESWKDKIFEQFVTDTLANAAWTKDYKKWIDIPQENRQLLINAAVRGELADITDLYMEILKER
jgi:hypothetical protein